MQLRASGTDLKLVAMSDLLLLLLYGPCTMEKENRRDPAMEPF